jgi:acyl carrier protein
MCCIAPTSWRWHIICSGSAACPGWRAGKPQREEQQEHSMTTTKGEIRDILAQNGRLAVPIASLDDNADLFAAGLDSLAIVNVLMSLEEHFDIELPDEMLQRRSFSSIATIETVVASLTRQAEHT